MFYLRTPGGDFEPLTDASPVFKTATTETVIVRREDGSQTQEDRDCEPYAVAIRPISVVLRWSKEEREAVGIYQAYDAPTPDGKQRPGSGEPTLVFIEGRLTRVWDWEDAPPMPTRRIFGYTIIARLEVALGPVGSDALIKMVQANQPVAYARLISSPTGVAVDDERLLAALAKAKEAFPSLDIDAILAE